MRQPSILIVDDDPVQRGLLCGVFGRRINDSILTASCGREALNMLARPELNVTLVILDVHMPNCDGIEVILQLAERRCRAGIFVVSSNARILPMVDELAAGYNVNLLGLSTKPIDVGVLDLLAEWVNAERALAASRCHRAIANHSCSLSPVSVMTAVA